MTITEVNLTTAPYLEVTESDPEKALKLHNFIEHHTIYGISPDYPKMTVFGIHMIDRDLPDDELYGQCEELGLVLENLLQVEWKINRG